ncbi:MULTISPECIES: hypothetical protein [Pantoea]|jgi:hypothetical protein|uniref:Uncharacterized protein n=1 Tax=Pantoea brenneri TaxID=472694 RepID=A0A7Y6NH56_9GAMM|nr:MULTISPECIES: hypothetical protein [Pantoea]MBZ6397055.1 hypothetical protein [Pantoea sp.]MBZ6440194.1 hypothetical protein [Pantoea sp.]NUY43444.1 hypothetical protein [Pantoea brenneri]NUY50990.1 hypothetical protein [Pantoea brenneri]NUY61279.1 hypothetical protein [Pantoea brenneri]
MSNIQKVELAIEHAKSGIAFGEALDRLLNNRDFQQVIEQGYLREEAIRLVHLKADPGMYTESDQADIDRQISAIGQFKNWFHLQRTITEHLRKELKDNSDELEELRREEAEGAN